MLFCDIWHGLQICASESVLLPRATPSARRRLRLRRVKSKRPHLQNKSLFCPLLGVMSRYVVFKTKAPAFDCKAGALLLIRRRRSLRRARVKLRLNAFKSNTSLARICNPCSFVIFGTNCKSAPARAFFYPELHPLLGVTSRYVVFKTKAPAFDCKAGALLLI